MNGLAALDDFILDFDATDSYGRFRPPFGYDERNYLKADGAAWFNSSTCTCLHSSRRASSVSEVSTVNRGMTTESSEPNAPKMLWDPVCWDFPPMITVCDVEQDHPGESTR
jgi:hypothetical protein